MILESLYFLIKGDTSDLKKSTKEATADVSKLKNSLNSIEPATNKLGFAFSRLLSTATQALLAVASVGAIVHGIRETAEYTNELDNASNALNVNIETLDQWSQAVITQGGTLQGFTESLKHLSEHFNITSTNILKSLPKIADLFQKIGTVRSGRVGREMGLDDGTIRLLQEGKKGLDEILKRQKELGVITKQDAYVVKRFNEEWYNVTHQFRTLFAYFGRAVLPMLSSLMRGLETVFRFLESHKDLVVGSLIAIGSVLTGLLIPALIRGAIAAWAFVAPMLPWILLIGAAGVAFTLLYEDMMVFLKGGNSVIGHILKKWPIIGEIAKRIGDVWKTMIDGVKRDVDFIIKAIDKVRAAYEKIKSVFSHGKDFKTGLALAQKNIFEADVAPISAANSTALQSSFLNNKNTTINVGDITVQTQATDAKGITDSIGLSFQTYLRQAVNNYDDGVAI